MNRTKFDSFEGLRGILALFVCLGHYGINNAANRIGINLRYELAVDVFFGLSGFVLSHTGYFGKKRFAEFAVARLARLYPLHLASLIAILGFYAAAGRPIVATVLVEHGLLAHCLGIPPRYLYFNFPSWSISVELWLSIGLCLLLSFRARRACIGIGLGAVLVLVLFPGFQLATVETLRTCFSGGLLRGIAGFSVGIAAYIYAEYWSARQQLPRWSAYAALAGLLLVFLKQPLTQADSWLLYAFIFLVLVTVASNDQRLFLARPALVYLGALSYGIYLLHIPTVRWMEYLLSQDALRGPRKMLVLALLLPLAALANRYFERPAQGWIMRRLLPARRSP